jgi:hypothetical protein
LTEKREGEVRGSPEMTAKTSPQCDEVEPAPCGEPSRGARSCADDQSCMRRRI